jgi:hypothetical protein
MASHAYATPAGTLSLICTAKGLEVTGLGGQVILSNKMLAHLAEFSVAMLDLLQPDPEREPDDCPEDDDQGGTDLDNGELDEGNQ